MNLQNKHYNGFMKVKFTRPYSQKSFIEKAKLLRQMTIKKSQGEMSTSTLQYFGNIAWRIYT